MRNKQAKRLRKEAAQAAQAAINASLPEMVQRTAYELKWYNKYYSDPLTGKLKGYKVYTAKMEPCERAVYQAMKKQLKEGK